ncbi:MAG: hypothetical protein WCD70_10255 [Alphaproteobacteria bacterium]
MTARPNIQLIVDNAITKVAAEIANHAPGDKGDLSKETQTLLALAEARAKIIEEGLKAAKEDLIKRNMLGRDSNFGGERFYSTYFHKMNDATEMTVVVNDVGYRNNANGRTGDAFKPYFRVTHDTITFHGNDNKATPVKSTDEALEIAAYLASKQHMEHKQAKTRPTAPHPV